MALNPFRLFRKHQKKLLAGVTIMCMFLFVLSGGLGSGGDALDAIAGWFGGGRRNAEKVATLDGESITIRDLDSLRRQRMLANQYMISATQIAFFKMNSEVEAAKKSKASMGIKEQFELQQNARILQSRLFQPFYFGPYTSSTSLLDFRIWQKQADRLGIHLTDEAIKNEVDRLVFDRLTSKDRVELFNRLQGSGGSQGPPLNAETLKNALREEFRVRVAQAALTGNIQPGSMMVRMPSTGTPNEFWDYFKKARTEINVALLPVRVKDYVAKVEEKPTDQELQKLFKRYRNKEYDPLSTRPGFKQPQRIQVQWVSGTSDSPAIKAQAKQAAGVLTALQQFNGAINGPGLSGIASGTFVALPFVIDLPMTARYQREILGLPAYSRFRAARINEDLATPLPAKNINRASNIAGMVGQSFATRMPWSGWAAWQGAGMAWEKQERLQQATELFLSGLTGQSLSTAGLATQVAPKKRYLPMAQVKDQLEEMIQEDLAQGVVIANLDAIRKIVEENKKEPKELEKKLAEEIKRLGLNSGKTSELRSLHKNPIGDDPGLQHFKEAYMDPPSADPEGMNFGQVFFTTTKVFELEKWPGPHNFQGRQFDIWPRASEPFYFWKTEDERARTLKFTDPGVRAQVAKAWRWQEARELAKAEAEKLAKKAKDLKGDIQKLRDLSAASDVELMGADDELPVLARYLSPTGFTPAGMLAQYRLPEIAHSQVPDVDSTFITELLGLVEKPIGDTMVVPDMPENTFYVAVLREKEPPSMTEFYEDYNAVDQARRSQRARYPLGLIYFEFTRERMQNFFNDFTVQLRKQAKLELEDEEALRAFDGVN